MYTIITPTYKNHFCYIKKYLQSFQKYTTDKNKYEIVFTISIKESTEFLSIINQYKKNLTIKVLYFEDLLHKYNIKQSPEELLQKYGRFTFQTLKKFYTMLFCNSKHFLVLDSESMVVKKTSISKIFEQFFNSPYILGSKLELTKRHKIINYITQNINYLMNNKCDLWFLENFVWFYDKKILMDLFKEVGSPIEMAEKIYKRNKTAIEINDIKFGIFEILLYQNYLFKYAKKLNYRFICVDDELIAKLGKKNYETYKNNFYQQLNGHCGLIEQSCLLLDKSNYKTIGKIFKDNKINIIRCDKTDLKLYPLQKQFLEIVQPCILAASQEHCFGINNTWQNRLRIVLSSIKPFEKLKKHFLRFVEPFRKVINWIFEPFSILYYFIKVLFKICKNFRMIIGG